MSKDCESAKRTLSELYFANDIKKAPADIETAPLALETLPPELLAISLAGYADWGDLAKLACVQSSWKNLVADSAEFQGRDSQWELAMSLLHGDDKHAGGSICRYGGMETEERALAANNRGLQRNESLAVKYLHKIAGISVDGIVNNGESLDSKSVLPGDQSSDETIKHGMVDEPALIELANCYLHGIGVERNPRLAIHYLVTAYHCKKSLRAAHTLAMLYEYPDMSCNQIEIDVVAAFEWFKAAAVNDHVPSMAELALCYELGCGVEQDDSEALEWYTKAANKGCSPSHYSVGEHFEEARGVRMDHEEAVLWYYKAAKLGEEDGFNGLKRLKDTARRIIPECDHEAMNLLNVDAQAMGVMMNE